MQTSSLPCILEIAVDRTNEKGGFVASQIFLALHALSDMPHAWYEKAPKSPWFHFEIIQKGGRIRFFLICEQEYRNLLEGQLYAHYPNIEIHEVQDYLETQDILIGHSMRLSRNTLDSIKIYGAMKDKTEKESVDPLSSITSAFAKLGKDEFAVFHVSFSPLSDKKWRTKEKIAILDTQIPKWIKHLLLNTGWILQILIFPFRVTYSFLHLILQGIPGESNTQESHAEHVVKENKRQEYFGYGVNIVVAKKPKEKKHDMLVLRELTGTMNIFSEPNSNGFVPEKQKYIRAYQLRKPQKKYEILNIIELAGLVHLPTLYVKTPGVNWVTTRKFEAPHNLPSPETPNTPIGLSNFRGESEGFGIQPIDRARHVYIIGKTGMGKSTLLENMLYNDIMNGRGIALIDPHGDLADTILANIPKSRTNDIVLFDPSDTEYPIAFNMLDSTDPALRPIVASGLVSIFKKMFAESWGPRLEYILRNTILTLLLIPDTTLISIPLILTHESYRRKIVAKITDPILVQFWTQEFEKMAPAQMSEAINPILNKVGQFLSSPILRNILGQPKNPFSLRWIMDNQKIFIVNLSKGKIGEDASALLGAMMVTKFQIEAMSRADMAENQRKDFGLYVDEFQNFATDSFATILSEARKYKLSLTMANQYIAQMPETVQGAVFGNVGSLISFQVGYDDATKFAEIFGGEDIILPSDLTNLRKYDIYTKLLIDGMPSPVFSATTYGPIHQRIDVQPQQSREVLLKVSREKYTKKREFVEKKIYESAGKISEEEKKYRQEQAEYKEKKRVEKSQERKKQE